MQASTSSVLPVTDAPALIANAAGKSGAQSTHEQLPPILSLTSIRFFMALSVIGIHYTGTFNGPKPIEICTQLINVIVPAFYALSGFILTYQYGYKNKATLADYFVARFARIFPLYWFCFFLVLVVGPIQSICPPNFALAFGACFLGIQSWFPSSDIFWAFNPPTYSVSAEIAFYCIFPFLIRGGMRITSAVTFASFLLFCYLAATTSPETRCFAVAVLPLTSLYYFLSGTICARIFFYFKDRKIWPGSVGSVGASLLEMGSLAMFLSAKTISSLCPWPNFATAYTAEKSLGTLSFLCFIYALALQKGFISRALSNKHLFMLGNATYAIYLLHDILLRALQNYRLNYENTGLFGFLLFCTFTIAISIFAHYVIESPWRRFIIDKFRSKTFANVKGTFSFKRFASMSFVFLPIMILCFFAAAGWWPKAPLDADNRIDTKLDKAAITGDTKNILFGDAYRLDKITMWKCKDGVKVKTFWTAEKTQYEHQWLCVHALDNSGTIQKNLDHALSPDNYIQKGNQWCDTFVIPDQSLAMTKTLGIAVCPDPQHLLSVTGGNSDWNHTRLLVPLDLEQLTLKELRQSGNGAI